LPIRDKFVEAIKYNKTAGSNSIVAELLKSGGPSLMNALNEMVWIGEILPENWTVEILFPVCKKSDQIDCKNYHGICLLNAYYPFQTR
jgi:hypothetical protein